MDGGRPVEPRSNKIESQPAGDSRLLVNHATPG